MWSVRTTSSSWWYRRATTTCCRLDLDHRSKVGSGLTTTAFVPHCNRPHDNSNHRALAVVGQQQQQSGYHFFSAAGLRSSSKMGSLPNGHHLATSSSSRPTLNVPTAQQSMWFSTTARQIVTMDQQQPRHAKVVDYSTVIASGPAIVSRVWCQRSIVPFRMNQQVRPGLVGPILAMHQQHQRTYRTSRFVMAGLSDFRDSVPRSQRAAEPVGRPWSAKELRRKSYEDLHKLWYVCGYNKNLRVLCNVPPTRTNVEHIIANDLWESLLFLTVAHFPFPIPLPLCCVSYTQ
jgi:Mitochondrial 39-S ribosomal protein L47 (MRP-L47)